MKYQKPKYSDKKGDLVTHKREIMIQGDGVFIILENNSIQVYKSTSPFIKTDSWQIFRKPEIKSE